MKDDILSSIKYLEDNLNSKLFIILTLKVNKSITMKKLKTLKLQGIKCVHQQYL